MLGDYVIIHCFDGSDIVIKVTAIDGENGSVYGISKEGSHWSKIENIKPIPLIPKVLIKNGFPFDEEGTEKWKDWHKDTIEYYKFPLGEGFYIEHNTVTGNFWISDHCWIQFKYAHEFQHVLRMCGIKKEIVL